MDFRLGSALAGVHDTGNVMEDVRFFGGQYGIWTRTPSPGWQFTAVDVSFDGQTVAAIRETAAGLTLIRPSFRNVPSAVIIDANAHDELWIKDGRMEDISGPAILISLETEPADGNQHRERGVPARADVRAAPRQRQDLRGARRDLRDQGRFRTACTSRRRRDADRDHRRLRHAGADDDAGARAVGPRRVAAHGHLGEHPGARRPGRRRHRRHGGLPQGHRRPQGHLPADGLLRHQRHADPEARHGADRPAPARDGAGAARQDRGLPGRRSAEGDGRDAEGRHERADRPRDLHQRHQPARGRREMDGGPGLDDERRPAAGRPRHQQPRRHTGDALQQQPDG